MDTKNRLHKAFWADMVLFNGNVIKVDSINTVVEAIAVKDGRILAVGKTEKIKQLAGKVTKKINLEGRTVLPGFIESHNHFLDYGVGMSRVQCRIPLNRKISEIVARIKERAEEIPAGEWIQGAGYDDTLIADKRHLSRWDLDEVVPENPVLIYHISGHLAYVNSVALKLAEITKNTLQPKGGRIVVDPNTGEPTGILEESPAIRIVTNLMPPTSLEDYLEGSKRACKEFIKVGVTSIHDAGVSTTSMRAYRKLIDSGELPLRVYMMTRRELSNALIGIGLNTGFGNDRLKIGAIKIVQDGSIQGYTGALSKPYYRKPEWKAYLIHSQEELNKKVVDAHMAGFQVAIHGNGDWGIDSILDAYEYALMKYPRKDHRHRIEHCQMVRDDQLDRMKKLGVVASFFNTHVYYWGDRHRDIFIGPERARRISPLKSALCRGITFGGHSDCGVTPVSPLFNIYIAATRITRDGKILGPKQRISVMDGIRAMTINAAYLAFEEEIKGSIEPGKLADFVILSENPTTISPEKIKDIQVEMTLIGGKIVYKKIIKKES